MLGLFDSHIFSHANVCFKIPMLTILACDPFLEMSSAIKYHPRNAINGVYVPECLDHAAHTLIWERSDWLNVKLGFPGSERSGG